LGFQNGGLGQKSWGISKVWGNFRLKMCLNKTLPTTDKSDGREVTYWRRGGNVERWNGGIAASRFFKLYRKLNRSRFRQSSTCVCC